LKSNNQIRKGALLSYFSIGVNLLSGLLYTPWMVSQIGQTQYGLYTLANSLISLFLIDVGLGTAASRYVAKYRAQNREELIPDLLGAVYKLYLIIDGIILLALLTLFFSIDRIYVNLAPAELKQFKVVFAIAGIYSVLSFPCTTFNGVLNAYEQFVPLKVADMVQRVGSVLLTVAALWLGLGLYALVAIQAASGCVANLIKFSYVQKMTGVRFTRHGRDIYKGIFSISFWTCVYGLAQRLIFNITPTILAMTVRDAAVAISIFGVVSTIEGYCYIVTTAINGMFLSRISRILQKANSEKELNNLAINVGRFQFVLNGLILLGFALVGKEFLRLWMGPEFELAYYGVLFVTIPGLFFNALQIFHTTMIAQNMVRDQAMIQIGMGVVNVILSFICSYLWGVVGATLSIFVAYSFRVVMTLLLIRKKLKMNINLYIRNCYLRMGTGVLVTAVVSAALLRYIGSGTWMLFLIKAMLIAVVYAFSQAVFGLSRNERAMLIGKLQNFR
jgi:O-antigen/teichoic acid export membrane protein